MRWWWWIEPTWQTENMRVDWPIVDRSDSSLSPRFIKLSHNEIFGVWPPCIINPSRTRKIWEGKKKRGKKHQTGEMHDLNTLEPVQYIINTRSRSRSREEETWRNTRNDEKRKKKRGRRSKRQRARISPCPPLLWTTSVIVRNDVKSKLINPIIHHNDSEGTPPP